jgi:amino acid transporter
MQGTGSVGISILFWLIGGIASMAGILVYTEFGLTIPRHDFDGEKKSVPRSGGEKNYVSSASPNGKVRSDLFSLSMFLNGLLS